MHGGDARVGGVWVVVLVVGWVECPVVCLPVIN